LYCRTAKDKPAYKPASMTVTVSPARMFKHHSGHYRCEHRRQFTKPPFIAQFGVGKRPENIKAGTVGSGPFICCNQ
jgi:hypothetical protein